MLVLSITVVARLDLRPKVTFLWADQHMLHLLRSAGKGEELLYVQQGQ